MVLPLVSLHRIDCLIGAQYRIRVMLKKNGASYVATGYADPAPGACPPAVARVG